MTPMAFKCDNEKDWLDAQRYVISSGYSWHIFSFPTVPIEKPDNHKYPMYLYINPKSMNLEYDDEFTLTDAEEFGYVVVDYSDYIRQYKIGKIFLGENI